MLFRLSSPWRKSKYWERAHRRQLSHDSWHSEVPRADPRTASRRPEKAGETQADPHLDQEGVKQHNLESLKKHNTFEVEIYTALFIFLKKLFEVCRKLWLSHKSKDSVKQTFRSLLLYSFSFKKKLPRNHKVWTLWYIQKFEEAVKKSKICFYLSG